MWEKSYIKEGLSKGGSNVEEYIEMIGYLSKKVAEYTNSYKRLKENIGAKR